MTRRVLSEALDPISGERWRRNGGIYKGQTLLRYRRRGRRREEAIIFLAEDSENEKFGR